MCSHAASNRQYQICYPHTRKYCQQAGPMGLKDLTQSYAPILPFIFSPIDKNPPECQFLEWCRQYERAKRVSWIGYQDIRTWKPSFLACRSFIVAHATRLISLAQATRSAEDGLSHVDLNRNVEALYVRSRQGSENFLIWCPRRQH